MLQLGGRINHISSNRHGDFGLSSDDSGDVIEISISGLKKKVVKTVADELCLLLWILHRYMA